jgi:hypothetical protein
MRDVSGLRALSLTYFMFQCFVCYREQVKLCSGFYVLGSVKQSSHKVTCLYGSVTCCMLLVPLSDVAFSICPPEKFPVSMNEFS